MTKNLLGLNYSGVHDSAISVVAPDGDILLAVAEERMTRHKKEGRWPEHCLSLVDLDTIEGVCVPYLPNDAQPVVTDRPEFAQLALPRRQRPAGSEAFWRFDRRWQERLDTLQKPIHYVDHHDAHAASAYYLCNQDDVLVITCDSGARNCPWWAGAYHGKGGQLTPLLRLPIRDYHPAPDAYSDMTAILGFRPMAHEGKITGLAAHGKVSDDCLAAVTAVLRDVRDHEPPIYQWVGSMEDALPPSMQVNRLVAARFRDRLARWSAEDLAATIQHWLEEKVLALVGLARQRCDAPHVAMAGGAFANVRLNQKVYELGFSSAFVCPPMTDDGLCVGAVLHYLGQHHDLQPRRLANVFVGPEVKADAASAALDEHRIHAAPCADIAATIADRLADGRTVARWQGRMELGPRALGNRTVYYRADDESCQEWLNEKLQRTEFMPFAPITLDEAAEGLYRDIAGARYAAEFMTVCFECTELMKNQSPAVVHVDNTARPQLVTAESNPDAWAILCAYRARTGVPTLINTSFNIHEEPIVCSAADALTAFVESGLDYLALGNYLLSADDCAAVAPQTAARQLRRREVALAQKDAFAGVLAQWLETALRDRAATTADSLAAEAAQAGLQERVSSLEETLAMAEARADRARKALAEERIRADELHDQLHDLRTYIERQERSLIWRGVKKLHDLKGKLGSQQSEQSQP
ncbi:MAG: carbamoyltransferase C-terminal domain-containing protein [Planctomycetota bacterium]|jgi:carbamoyltransferase